MARLFESSAELGELERFERQVLRTVTAIAAAAIEVEAPGAVERLDAVVRGLAAREATLVVMGEFGAGKSSLLNAYLGEPALLPVDAYVSTRVVTSVRWGDPENVVVTLAGPDGSAREERTVSRTQLPGYLCEAVVAEGRGETDGDRVLSVSITTPNPRLRNGLALIDTPGIGGVHRGHTAAALAVLPQASAVIYLVPADEKVRPSELAFISHVARALNAEHCPERLIFAMTKADSTPDPEAALSEAREQLTAVPGVSPHCPVVAVSARHRLVHLVTPEPEDPDRADRADRTDRADRSGFPQFEAALDRALQRVRVRVRYAPALAEMAATVRSLIGPSDDALDALEARDAQQRQSLLDTSRARQGELTELEAAASTAFDELGAALQEVIGTLRARAATELGQVWRDLRTSYRSSGTLRSDPQAILDDLANRLALLVGQLEGEAATLSTQAVQRVADHHALGPATLPGARSATVAPPPLPTLPTLSDAPVPVPAPPRVVDDLSVAFQTALAGARVGAQLGAVAGELAWDQAMRRTLPGGSAIVAVRRAGERAVTADGVPCSPGPFVGALAGAAVGATLAFVNQVRATVRLARANQVTALDALFAPWEEQQRTFLEDAATDLVQAHAATVRAELTDRIDRRRAECQAAVTAVTAALDADVPADPDAARQRLSARRATLGALADAVAELVDDLPTHLG
jgi:hypothetical protein